MSARTAHLQARLAIVLIAVFVLLAVAYTLAIPAPALAFDEVNGGFGECHYPCHHQQIAISPGPHGNYVTSSRKCDMCHSVHAAGGSLKLLLADTILDSCLTCHDGTAGKGVYGAVAARGLSVESGHSNDTTNTVPGGDRATGGSSVATYTGENNYLTCTDCHSPHANDLVAGFQGERFRRSVNESPYRWSRLLRAQPSGGTTRVAEYGSDWCLSCHAGRSSSGPVHNHPVETTAVADYFYYDNVSQVTTWGTSSTQTGTLGLNNRGYVMPSPRSADQAGHNPICQQCHEDGRNVGDVTPGQLDLTEVWSVTALDGAGAADNPRFQTFPHESNVTNLLIETEDDLCLNCHPPAGLP